MSETMELTFTLNGKPVTVTTPPGRPALQLLRDAFGLTAAKEGCGSGECGACTVLIDATPRLSCLTLAAELAGRTVVTAEGLGSRDAPHPVQEAFAVHGAVQCGYCTPGMTVTAAHLLAHNPCPDRDTVRQAIAGNLCRCTGYVKIVDAVLAAAETLAQATPAGPDPAGDAS